MRHVIQNEITAELIYLNVRGLNKKDIQDKIRKMANDSANNNQIIALVETKMKYDFKLEGFKDC